jgi:hypothetical protein
MEASAARVIKLSTSRRLYAGGFSTARGAPIEDRRRKAGGS